MISLSTPRTIRLVKYGLPLAAAALIAAGCSSGGGSTAAPAGGSAGSSSSSAAAGSAGSTIVVTGGHLTDASGRTVYLWLADTGAKSTCNGACAAAWPPVPGTAMPSAGNGADSSKLATISRDDGTSQLAYAGHPLYYFSGDSAAGDTNGQGSNGFGARWWEVDASGQAITSTAGPATTSKTPKGGGGYGY